MLSKLLNLNITKRSTKLNFFLDLIKIEIFIVYFIIFKHKLIFVYIRDIMNNKDSYSVILPTLNEAGHIKSLLLDISKIFYNLKLDYEIIIVDDNSSDGTSGSF